MIAQKEMCNSRMNFQDAVEKPMELAREYPVSSMLVVFSGTATSEHLQTFLTNT